MRIRHQVQMIELILLHEVHVSEKEVELHLLVHVSGIEVVLLHQARVLEEEVAHHHQAHALEKEVVIYHQDHVSEKEVALLQDLVSGKEVALLQDHVLGKEGALLLQVHVSVSEVHLVKLVRLLEHEAVLIRQVLVSENEVAFSHLDHGLVVLLRDHVLANEVARLVQGVLAWAEWTHRFTHVSKKL